MATHAEKAKVAPLVFENLKRLSALNMEARVIAMKLLSHPDTTANRAMEIQASLVKLNREYSEVYYSAQNHFQGHEPRWFDWGNYRPLVNQRR